MKKTNQKLISLGLLVAASLFSCSGGGELTPIYHLNNNEELVHGGDIKLYYPKNNEVPYVALEDGVQLASLLRSSTLGSESYKYTVTGNKDLMTVKDERGTKAVFDSNNQTVVIDNFESFVFGYRNQDIPLMAADLTRVSKAIKLVENECTTKSGNSVTLKLSDYPTIQLEKSGNTMLIPLAVLNDIFVSGDGGSRGISYNYKEAYIVGNGLVNIGDGSLTTLGKEFYNRAPKKTEISKELAQYAYDETTFTFDYFYGLKSLKGITSFKALAKEKGLEEDLLSGNVEKMNDAYATLLMKSLEDGHTAYLSPMAFTNMDEYEIKDSSRSEKAIKKDAESAAMSRVRKERGLNKPFEVRGDTAFIFFDDFMEIDESKLYDTITEADIAANNTLLFAYAYKEIKKNSNIKNVVVDMVTNNGGDATGLIYCLGTLIGKHHIDTMNPLTGATTKATFAVDINTDGNIDENDVPLINDYKIFMLDSKFAFSCGNLFPVAAKYNNPNVKILGDVTGGGTCIVSTQYNGLGAQALKSGLLMLTKKTESGYTNIEDGAAVDIPVSYDRMLDRNYIVNLINS